MTIEEILQEIIRIGQKYSVKEIILFGSRAKGTAMERSDIDIAVRGAEDFDSFVEETENILTLYTIDIVSLEECRNELLVEDIEKYGRKIYEKI